MKDQINLNFGKSSFQIGNNIFNVFNADSQPEEIIHNAEFVALFPGVAVIGHSGGMRDERLHAAHGFVKLAHFADQLFFPQKHAGQNVVMTGKIFSCAVDD